MLELFFNVIALSIAACVSVAIVCLFRKGLKQKYSIGWVCGAWIVIAVRMLLPIQVSNDAVSLQQGLLQMITGQQGTKQSELVPETSIETQGEIGLQSVKRNEADTQELKLHNTDQTSKDTAIDAAKPGLDAAASSAIPSTATNSATPSTGENLPEVSVHRSADTRILYSVEHLLQVKLVKQAITILCYIWAIGCVLALALQVSSYCHFLKRVSQKKMRAVNIDTYEILKRLMKEYNITRNIGLYTMEEIQSPMLLGLIRPGIYIPKIEYTKEEMEVILKHELTHYRHKDVLKKLLLQIVQIIYWFCPAVYIMKQLGNRDMELYCDETVIRDQSMEYKKVYSLTILKTIKVGQNLTSNQLTACLTEGKKEIKERFSHILSGVKRRKGIGLLIISAFVILLICGICIRPVRKMSKTVMEKTVDSSDSVQAGIQVLDEAIDELKDEKVQKVTKTDVTSIHNILLIGKFLCDGQDDAAADCIMIANIDWEKKKISFTSINRNLFVQDQDKMIRLGQIYLKDKDIMCKLIEKELAIKIDGMISAETMGFAKIVDAIGGVELDLTDVEAKYLNTTNYIAKKEYRCVMPGLQRLNGTQVAGYARVRHVKSKDGNVQDMGRMDRHQQIMNAIYQKMQTIDLDQILSLTKTSMKEVKTDLSLDVFTECLSQWKKSSFEFASEAYPKKDDIVEVRYENSYGIIAKEKENEFNKFIAESTEKLTQLFPNPHDLPSEIMREVDLDGDGNIEKVYLKALDCNGGDGGYELQVFRMMNGKQKEIALPKLYQKELGFPYQMKWDGSQMRIMMDQTCLETIDYSKVEKVYRDKELTSVLLAAKDKTISHDCDPISNFTIIGPKEQSKLAAQFKDSRDSEKPTLVLKSYITGLGAHADCFGYGITEMQLNENGEWNVNYYFLFDSIG